jgi:DNA-binding NarL/FixJ family response regulator
MKQASKSLPTPSPKPAQPKLRVLQDPSPLPATVQHRILLIEHRPVVREWFDRAIEREADLAPCTPDAECKDLREILACISNLRPDLVMVGSGYRGCTAMEMVAQITAVPGFPPVLFIAPAADDEKQALALLRGGLRGYISFHEPAAKIWAAARTLLAGGIYLSEPTALHLVRTLVIPDENADPDTLVGRLSDRELTVFKFIGIGDMPSEIAVKMKVSVKTVESFRARIIQKLRVKGARDLSHVAIGWMSRHLR